MRKRDFIFWSLLVGLILFRLYGLTDEQKLSAGNCLREIVEGKGVVVEEPVRKENGQTLVVEAIDLKISSTSAPCFSIAERKIKMVTKIYPQFSFNDHVSFKGRLLQPRNFDSGNGRVFDYVGYLSKDEIFFEIKSAIVLLHAGDKSDIEVGNSFDDNKKGLSDHVKNFFFDKERSLFTKIVSNLYRLKRNFVKSLEENLGEPYSALASGLVVGEKASLGKELLDSFRIVGLTHIIVLSGFNITIVADSIRRLLAFLPRVWGILIGVLGITIFGILVGGGATVVRSCFMAGIALSADLIRRDYSVVRALIFVGLIMIIINPKILFYDPSFQLSFLATLGLIVLAGPIEKRLTFITEKFGLRGIIASTIATQIFVSPYLLYMMGQVSVIGIIVNILVLPLVPLTMLMVFITGILGMFSYLLATLPAWFSHFLLSYELFVVKTFAKIPYASLTIKTFSFWWVVGFYVVFVVVIVWRKYKLSIINNQ